MNTHTEEFRLYFARIRPLYNELFSMAHVICGNYEQAEFALSTAILSGWNNRRNFRSARAFRENMRSDMRRIAISSAKPDAELTWDVRRLTGEEGETGLADIHDDLSVLRVVVMHYGCGVSVRDISRLTGYTRRQTEKLLRRFEMRAQRRLDTSRPEAMIEEMCIDELLASPGAPDVGAIFRTFEAEAERSYRPASRLAGRIVSAVAYVLAVALAAGAIWVISALVRPARIADDGLMTETLNEQ